MISPLNARSPLRVEARSLRCAPPARDRALPSNQHAESQRHRPQLRCPDLSGPATLGERGPLVGRLNNERHTMSAPCLFPGALHQIMTVGADLDLTLIDTRDATALALKEVNATCGESIDIEDFLSRLGLPLRDEFARFMPADRVTAAVTVFRTTFLDHGLYHLTPLPGATDLADQLRDSGRRLVVITSRVPQIAHACLDAIGLPANVVVGDVTGLQKAQPMIEHQVEIYLGDHPLDLHGAQAAGVPAIGVATGTHTRDQLLAAGANWVVDSLAEVAAALM